MKSMLYRNKSFERITVVCLVFLSIGLVNCKKEYSLEGRIENSINVSSFDSTITDSTLFIDFQLDGQRVFQIDRRSSKDAHWTWLATSSWTNSLPDKTYFPNSNLRGGLCADASPFYQPAFYFVKNEYGLDRRPFQLYNNAFNPPLELPLLKPDFVDRFLKAGSYPFAASLMRDTTYQRSGMQISRTLLGTGIQFTWIDSTGKIWQTSRGGGQFGSSFNILKTESFIDPQSHLLSSSGEDYSNHSVITASFACMLYDAYGNARKITNGKLRFLIFYYTDM